MESDGDGEDEYLAGYQPGIMEALQEHWRQSAISMLK